MARWQGGTRERVQEAALALFADRGYAATTVDDIAADAGVSARTVFRHFRDKEEVLFGADGDLVEVLLAAARAAPPDTPAPDVAARALDALAAVLEPSRAALRRRAAVLASDVALHGRDLAKQARWIAEMAAELERRGTAPEAAELIAATAGAAFRVVYSRWLADDGADGGGPGLAARLAEARTAQAQLWTSSPKRPRDVGSAP